MLILLTRSVSISDRAWIVPHPNRSILGWRKPIEVCPRERQGLYLGKLPLKENMAIGSFNLGAMGNAF